MTTGTEPVSIRKDAASLSLASLVRGYARTAVQATSLVVSWSGAPLVAQIPGKTNEDSHKRRFKGS